MIDFHSHILPGIDDGAKNFAESLEMAQKASELNINAIVATPHYISNESLYEPEDIFKKVKALNDELKKQAIRINILPGQEVYLTPDIPGLLKSNKIITLGNQGKYLLVELPMHDYPAYIDNVLFEIMLGGVVPVIAHPERNRILAKHPRMLFKLVEKGIFTQVNNGSFHGRYGEKAKAASELFYRNGYLHFHGYDAHSSKDYKNILSQDYSFKDAEHAFTNNEYLRANPKEYIERSFFELLKSKFSLKNLRKS